MRRPLSLLAFACVLLIAGCGGSSSKPAAHKAIAPRGATSGAVLPTGNSGTPTNTTNGGTAAPTSADDAAKALASTAESAADTIGTNNGGSYATVTAAELAATTPTIQTAPGNGNAYVSSASGTTSSYQIVVTAAGSGETYTITQESNGDVVQSCAPSTGATGSCPGGTW
ncbi:MAG: hypothetical protein ABSG64_09230 [Solirubrobacteraceae bacterium]|jgi:hypothetical protein